MRSLTVMTICSGSQTSTRIVSPKNQLGDNHDKSRQTRRVNEIPDDVGDNEVIRLFELTTDITWLNGKLPRLEFDFSELGEGKIIKE